MGIDATGDNQAPALKLGKGSVMNYDLFVILLGIQYKITVFPISTVLELLLVENMVKFQPFLTCLLISRICQKTFAKCIFNASHSVLRFSLV